MTARSIPYRNGVTNGMKTRVTGSGAALDVLESVEDSTLAFETTVILKMPKP
jgi:hypothetical protein